MGKTSDKTGLKNGLILFITCFCLLGVLVQNCFAARKTLSPIKLQLKWRNQFQFAGYYAAKIKGYYKKNGLSVEIIPGGPGINPLHRVLKGEADVGVFDPGILLNKHNQKSLIVLATIMQSSGYCIISLKEKNILKPWDLVGKKVLVEQGQGWGIFKAILLKEGISLNSIKTATRLKDSEEIANGDADAVVTYITSQPQRLRDFGYKINIIRPEEYGVDFYGDILFTTKDFAYADSKKTDAFIQASVNGWKYALAHEDEVIGYILTLPDVKAYGTTRKQLKQEAQQIKKLIMPQLVEIGHTNLGRWQYMLKLLQELGIADKDFSLKDFIYDSKENKATWWFLPLVYSSVVILILVIAIMLINLQLRKRVKLKTAELTTEIENRKLAEYVANESKEQIELILMSSNIGLWELEIKTKSITFSKQFKKILGYADDYDFNEKDFLKKIHPEDLRITQRLFTTHGKDDDSNKMIQFRVENSAGEYLHVLSSSKLLFQNNEPVKVSGVLLSINELKKKELEILQVSQELIRRNDELKKFAYITSHNLRGPVVNLSSLSGMIDQTALDAENAVIFAKITESIYKLENTLNDLIEVVSQEKAQVRSFAKINIEENINDVLNSVESQIFDANVTFNINLTVKEIAYPKPYFESIILNLVTNAIKYRSASRELIIDIESFKEGDYAILKFSDNGIGIDLSKNRSKIFGLYQRFNPEIQGKGIGLFIIKSHLDSFNGKIEVESTLDTGTTFTISFLNPVVR